MKDRAIAAEAAARQVGAKRNRAPFMFERPADLAQRIGSKENWSQAQTQTFQNSFQGMSPRDERQFRRQLADQHAPQNRGPLGMEMGPNEWVNHQIANKAYVRNGILPGAIAGGGIMAGAALTEGAQQLMALMGFIEQGRQQEARVEQSPLIQPGSMS